MTDKDLKPNCPMIAAPWRGCVAVQMITNNAAMTLSHARLGCDSEARYRPKNVLGLNIKDGILQRGNTKFNNSHTSLSSFSGPEKGNSPDKEYLNTEHTYNTARI